MDRSARAKRKRPQLFQLATESPVPNCPKSNSPGNSTSIQTSPQPGRMHETNRRQVRPIGRVVEKPAIRSDCPFRKAIPYFPDGACHVDTVRMRTTKDAWRRPKRGALVRGWCLIRLVGRSAGRSGHLSTTPNAGAASEAAGVVPVRLPYTRLTAGGDRWGDWAPATVKAASERSGR